MTIEQSFWDTIYPLIFSLHKNRISLHRIEFQRKSGDIKKEMFEWNKIRGSRRTNAENSNM